MADPGLVIFSTVILAEARIQGSIWLLLFSIHSPGGRPGADLFACHSGVRRNPGSPVADRQLVTFSCTAKREVTKEKAAPGSSPLRGVPVLLDKLGACGTRCRI
jgi:hypothetical protein